MLATHHTQQGAYYYRIIGEPAHWRLRARQLSLGWSPLDLCDPATSERARSALQCCTGGRPRSCLACNPKPKPNPNPNPTPSPPPIIVSHARNSLPPDRFIDQTGADADGIYNGEFHDDPGGLALKHTHKVMVRSLCYIAYSVFALCLPCAI